MPKTSFTISIFKTDIILQAMHTTQSLLKIKEPDLRSGLSFALGGVKSADEDASGCAGGKVQAIVNDEPLAHDHQHEDSHNPNAEHVGDDPLQIWLVHILHAKMSCSASMTTVAFSQKTLQ